MEYLAWPIAVILLGFGFMIIFRNAVSSLLSRTKKVSKGGLETFEAPQLPAPEEKPDALAEFLGNYDNPLLIEQEAKIEADLEEAGLTEPTAAHRALVRSLAGLQIAFVFQHK